jgi:hypothetical protein
MCAQTQQRRGGVRVPAYQCHPKLGEGACGGVSISPAGEVERVVVEAIQAALAASPKLRRRLDTAGHADAARLRAERDRVKDAMFALGSQLAKGMPADVYEHSQAALQAEYDAAVAALGALNTDLALPSVEDVTERWDSLTLAQQRAVVEHLIERIEVAPGGSGKPGFKEDRLGAPRWRA